MTTTADITLTKHHGLGNDFLVAFHPGLPEPALAEWAQALCDRRRGVGADGLLIGESAHGYAAQMVLYNADGSRAEMSGNGIRCFAQALAMRRGSAHSPDLTDQLIVTDAGDRLVQLHPTEAPNTLLVAVDMGPVDAVDVPIGWDALGCHPDRPVAHLSVGNPHSVVGVDDVDAVDLASLGGKVPGVNLEIVAPGDSQHEVRMRVHERGVGITEACGTGAVATAFAAARWGLATPRDGKLTVVMDGGSATVTLDAPVPGRVTLTGPATYVASVTISLPSTTS